MKFSPMPMSSGWFFIDKWAKNIPGFRNAAVCPHVGHRLANACTPALPCPSPQRGFACFGWALSGASTPRRRSVKFVRIRCLLDSGSTLTPPLPRAYLGLAGETLERDKGLPGLFHQFDKDANFFSIHYLCYSFRGSKCTFFVFQVDREKWTIDTKRADYDNSNSWLSTLAASCIRESGYLLDNV